MSLWDNYSGVMESRGITKRGTLFNREQRFIGQRIVDSLSYHTVVIEGLEQQMAVINSDNLNQKTLCSMPGEDIILGGLVEWSGEHWLVTERDANNEVYTKAKMEQCNYVLKWVDSDDVIHEQWCIVEDGTKYLTGEFENRDFVQTRGDSRIAVTIARNEFTSKLGRTNRFLIDDPDSEMKLAYAQTKPQKLYGVYNGKGVYKFVLQEVNTTKDDNLDLCIADYYKHFPRVPVEEVDEEVYL